VAGRLALTWAHKADALVSDGAGGYQWVAPSDVRAREVRLLDLVSTCSSPVDATDGTDGVEDNLLIRGDSLDALRALARTPEYAERYRGKVKLVYIDPPFNTGQAFEHYDDGLEHSIWLGMMRERLELIRDLLSPDGSVWVHLDDAEMAYCRVLMDELFGRRAFVSTVVWEKAQGARNDTDISSAHDYIMIYAKTERIAFRRYRNLLERQEHQIARYQNPDNDPRGPWRQGDNGTAKSGSEDYRFPISLPSGRVVRPPAGSYWRFSPSTFERAREEGRIWFGRDGDSLPVIKRYLAEVQDGVVPRTWWPATEVGSNQEAKRDHLRKLFPDREPFSTPKPERLLERVIHIGSNPGDIVLDAFAGSGTTAAVAHKMGRRWVTVEQNEATVDTFTRPRLVKVIDGADPGGISDAAGWTGGGGFVELRVARATFDEAPVELGGGVVVAANLPVGQLAASVAAQLGYALGGGGPESPFIASKGRARLAVIDGLADETAIEAIVAALDDGETATVAATAFTPGARAALAERAPGSRIVRIPDDLFPAAVIR